MSRGTLTAVAVLFTLLPASGCAYNVYVLGTPGPDSEREVSPALTLCVRCTPTSRPNQMSRQVAAKIEKILDERGYRVVPEAEADVLVFFEYTVDPMMKRVRLEPLGGSASGIETVRRQGPFDHNLSLWIVEADAYRKDEAERILWLGGAALGQAPTESAKFLDLLLVAAFDDFPMDTDDTIRTKLRLTDSRVKKIRL